MSKTLIADGDMKDKVDNGIDCMRDCPDLGHCCKRFVLTVFKAMPFDEKKSIKGVRRKLRKFKLPFEPFELSEDNNAVQDIGKKVWWFTCPLLGEDGKCGDYENRPDLCKKFVPGGGDHLCLIRPEGPEAKNFNQKESKQC